MKPSITIKDLGEAKYFLGMEIVRSESGTSLNQRKYILDILQTASLLGCKPVSTPLPPGLTLSKTGGTLLSDLEQYRRLVGQLLYLNLTRPGISYAVQQLSQFMNSPYSSYLDYAPHVLKYLKGCPSLGLFYVATRSFSI